MLASISYRLPGLLFIDWLSTDSVRQSESQSYFTTGGLLPIISSWRQAPRDSRLAFFSTEHLRLQSFSTSSLTRGRVCPLQLLLVLASAAILGSKFRGIHVIFYCLRFETPPTWRVRSPHLYSPGTGWPFIPLGTGFPFRRLLRLAGLRWRYSNPPPHAGTPLGWCPRYINIWHGLRRKHYFQQFLYCCAWTVRVGTSLFVKALFSNGYVYLLIKNLLPSSGCCFEVVTQ
jgi:hypothetical protein